MHRRATRRARRANIYARRAGGLHGVHKVVHAVQRPCLYIGRAGAKAAEIFGRKGEGGDFGEKRRFREIRPSDCYEISGVTSLLSFLQIWRFGFSILDPD